MSPFELIGKSRAMPRLERVRKLYIHVSYFKECFQKKKQNKHPISQDRKVVWVVSLCYMVPALLASFKNSHITSQSWLVGFLLFFWQRCVKKLFVVYTTQVNSALWLASAEVFLQLYSPLSIERRNWKKSTIFHYIITDKVVFDAIFSTWVKLTKAKTIIHRGGGD